VTISLGVAEWSPGNNFKNLLVRADSAMYKAKTGGRDRVVADNTPIQEN